MSDILFLVLRRMRPPLLLLVIVYAVATLGMTLMPGIDDNGEVYYMSFFHAFYFVSITGTTIGFGEIPYDFTDSQRAWALVCVYISVTSWLYAIGHMLSLVQDPTFKQALSHRAYRNSIQRIDLPFYIICGYGETGMLINRGLAELGLQTVIIDFNAERIGSLELEDLPIVPIALNADSTEPQSLVTAGLNHPSCKGLIAVTEDDHTNLKIAVSAKLMNKAIPVICRSEIEDEANNMASFGTDTIINPFQTFARRLNLLINKPDLHRLHNWLINQHSREYISGGDLPKGRWIICGFGRLGQAIHKQLANDGIELIIVDAHPDQFDLADSIIAGRGTEASTLREAGIMEAQVIIAATDDDANNLSILITARQLKQNIYTIGRVSGADNEQLFVQAKCDYIMRRSQVVANEALTTISRPLVSKFLRFSNGITEDETETLIGEILTITKGKNPITTRLHLNQRNAPAIVDHLAAGNKITLGQLCQNEKFPGSSGIALLIHRDGVNKLLPSHEIELQIDDDLLLCGRRNATLLAHRLCNNFELIDTLLNANPHHIPLLRWLSRRAHSKVAPESVNSV